MERKLASIQIVADLQPIPEADMIEVATINSWKLVVKKGEYKVGDLAIYCEIDSLLPIREEFEFLRKSSYKKMGDKEGFRLKTIRLKGQVSQGLLLPVTMLKGLIHLQLGNDVTEALGILKYEQPIPAQLVGIMRGNFPKFIPKTDEERIQNLTSVYANFHKNKFYVTEKLDGSSATFYYNNGYFGVCSRNIDLIEDADNSFWKIARQLDIEGILKKLGNYALQGELIGEGIQGNPYKLKGQQVRFFNAYDIDMQCYCSYEKFMDIMEDYSLIHVPVLIEVFELPHTIDELILFSEGKSMLHEHTEREGIVIRSHNRNISFKVISNKFLLKTF